MRFAKFVAEYNPMQSAWLKEPSGLAIYARIIHPSIAWKLGDVCLANMNNPSPGKGSLTAFLDAWEPHYRFSFENVLNLRLVAYLAKRGYSVTSLPFEYPPQMLMPKK